MNLLHNAAKYTPPQGRIELIAGVEGNEVVFRVRDNGVGISGELLPRIFDLFAQADRSLARSEGGLGIGLTLVKSLAELHGGTVTATSGGPDREANSSSGSLATPAWPRCRRSGRRPPGCYARHWRVLIVDDNVDMAVGMARLLTFSGHACGWRPSRRAASPWPASTGPKFSSSISACPAWMATSSRSPGRRRVLQGRRPVAVSGYGEEQARRRSEEAGINHHMVKPVNIAALFSILERP